MHFLVGIVAGHAVGTCRNVDRVGCRVLVFIGPLRVSMSATLDANVAVVPAGRATLRRGIPVALTILDAHIIAEIQVAVPAPDDGGRTIPFLSWRRPRRR